MEVINHTEDYRSYLIWVVSNGIEVLGLLDYVMPECDWDSIMFGYWYCNIKKN